MARLMGATCAAFAIILAFPYSAVAQTALPDIVVTVRREQPKNPQPRRAAPAHPQPSTGQQTAAVPGETSAAGQPAAEIGNQQQASPIDQPASVSVVRRQQIEQTPAQSLDDVLRTIPSVNLPITASYQVHPTGNFVSMRGLGGIRALVLLDGVPINDPFFGYVQWNRVPMQNIERVEVVRGGGSPLWGNYAMGGVINIITRVPDKNEIGGEAGYGSYKTHRANGYADEVVSDAFKVRANVNSWGTGGFNQVPAGSGTIFVPTSFNALNGQVTTYFKPDDSLRGYARFNFHDNDQTLITRLSTNNQQIYDFAGSVTKSLGPSDVTLTAFHEHSHFLTDNTNTPAGVPTGFGEFVQNRHTTLVDSTGASAQWSTRVNDVFRQLSIGADFHQIDGQDSAAIFDESGAQTRTDIGRGKQRFTGVFGQADIFPIDRFEILASARYQSFLNFDGFDGTSGVGPVPDSSATSFDPRISGRYALSSNLALRAAAYTSFRAPNLDNLYRAFSVPFGIFEPNSQLKPERLKGGEAGFDVNLGQLTGQFTVYTSQIEDLITFRNLAPDELPKGFSFGTRNINAGRAKADGIEATADWLFTAGWKATFGYAYMDSRIVENEFDPASVGKQQAGIPRWQASAGLSYVDPRGWRVSTRLRWLDKSWGDNDNTLPIDAHFVVDASIAYAFSKSCEAFLNIENLFNRRYVADNGGFNPPLFGTPFTAFAGLRVKLN
jgi:outer membrane receptor protein involved in Fe transport